MATKLSFNLQGYHLAEWPWRELMRRWQPQWPKIYNDNYGDPFFVEELFSVLAGGIAFRNHPMSEEKGELATNPAALGRRHAEAWIHLVHTHFSRIKGWNPARAAFHSINEPSVAIWHSEPGNHYVRLLDRPNPADRVAEYTYHYLTRLSQAGLRGISPNLSVGWPDNLGKDRPVDWPYFDQLRGVIASGGHFLCTHEYFGPQGPQAGWGWLCGRIGQCPWTNVEIIIGEAGLDHGVIDGVLTGWHLHITKEQYLQFLKWYDKEMRRDTRVKSIQLFVMDHAKEWWHFDLRPLMWELIEYAEQEAHIGDGTPKRIPYYPPNAIVQPPSGNAFDQWLRTVGQQIATVPVTPDFAVYKAILAHGFIPNGPEVRQSYGGKEYIMRSAENGKEKRTYYTEPGNWGNVRYIVR